MPKQRNYLKAHYAKYGNRSWRWSVTLLGGTTVEYGRAPSQTVAREAVRAAKKRYAERLLLDGEGVV